MILQSDIEWKQQMERKLRSMEAALGKAGIELDRDEDDMDEEEDSPPERYGSTPGTARLSQAPIGHAEKHAAYDLVMDPDSGPAAIPGSVFSPIAMPGFETNRAHQDIISRGIVSVQQAQSYLDIYQSKQLDVWKAKSMSQSLSVTSWSW